MGRAGVANNDEGIYAYFTTASLHAATAGRYMVDTPQHPSTHQSIYKIQPILPQSIGQADGDDEKKEFASIGGSVRPMTRCDRPCASTEGPLRGAKIRIINVVFLRTLSEIKLKRTDTTLDLSQKAKRAGEEKKKEIK